MFEQLLQRLSHYRIAGAGFSLFVATSIILRKYRRPIHPHVRTDIGSNARMPPFGTYMDYKLPTRADFPMHPSIVKLSIFNANGMCRGDIGVVVFSDGETVTVLCRAWFLYKSAPSETGSRKLNEGPVTVALQSCDVTIDGPNFQAVVVHVDFSYNVAVLKFPCTRQLPTADFSSSSNLSVGQQLVSINLGCLMQYLHENPTVSDLSNGICGDFFHTDLPNKMEDPGVFLLDGKPIGFRMFECPHDGSLDHGLLLDCCAAILELSKKLSVDCRHYLNTGVPVELGETEKVEEMFLMYRLMQAEMELLSMDMEEIASARHF